MCACVPSKRHLGIKPAKKVIPTQIERLNPQVTRCPSITELAVPSGSLMMCTIGVDQNSMMAKGMLLLLYCLMGPSLFNRSL